MIESMIRSPRGTQSVHGAPSLWSKQERGEQIEIHRTNGTELEVMLVGWELDDDTLRVDLAIEDAIGTDMRRGAERGGHTASAALPYFIQMKGTARLSGRVGGQPIAGTGSGFFETYR